MKFWQRDVGSWRKKTSSLSFEDQGAYAAILDAYYTGEGALPMDRNAVYKMTGAFSKSEQKAVDRVLANGDFFFENGGNLHNSRADEEIQKYRIYCENQRRRRMGIKK